jgi:hypothetical protein
VRREVDARRDGRVIGSANNIRVLWRQRHRALGNMVRGLELRSMDGGWAWRCEVWAGVAESRVAEVWSRFRCRSSSRLPSQPRVDTTSTNY